MSNEERIKLLEKQVQELINIINKPILVKHSTEGWFGAQYREVHSLVSLTEAWSEDDKVGKTELK